MGKLLHDLEEKYFIYLSIDDNDKDRIRSIVTWTSEALDLTVKEKCAKDLYPKRGEIWTCHFGENVGSEVNKIRPCVIVQNDIGNKNSPTTIIVPISNREEKQPTQVSLTKELFDFLENNLSGITMTEQIKTVSKARLGRKIGELSSLAMEKINDALKVSLSLL